MFNITYSRKSKLAGTIEFDHQPWSLGFHKDVHGNEWDIYYYGRTNENGEYESCVSACPVNLLHPYFSGTDNVEYGLVQQTWLPYKVKIIRDLNVPS